MSSQEQAGRSYANHGEDLEVLKHFGDARGTFVEAGANHPIQGSQTYLLEQCGWRGVLIEPNPKLAALCRNERPNSRVFECALVEPGGPGQVRMLIPRTRTDAQAAIVRERNPGESSGTRFDCKARTLDSVLEEAGLDTIDFLSIDLEGHEAPALLGFSWDRWKPKLVSVEDHCESLRPHQLICGSGYRVIRRIGDNHWYIPAASATQLTLREQLRLTRKLYLSMPFRKLRALLRNLPR